MSGASHETVDPAMLRESLLCLEKEIINKPKNLLVGKTYRTGFSEEVVPVQCIRIYDVETRPRTPSNAKVGVSLVQQHLRDELRRRWWT